MKTVLLTILMFSFISCKSQTNSKVWTKQYEQGFYSYLDSISKPSMADILVRSKYIVYVVKRCKEELPNGLNSVSKDSLHNLNIRIGREYALRLNSEGIHDSGITPYYTLWTPIIEKTLRDDFMIIGRNNGLKITDDFCDCVILKLKKIYPDSLLIPVPQKLMNGITMECKNTVSIK